MKSNIFLPGDPRVRIQHYVCFCDNAHQGCRFPKLNALRYYSLSSSSSAALPLPITSGSAGVSAAASPGTGSFSTLG